MTVGGEKRLATLGIAADMVFLRIGRKLDGGEDDAEGEYDEDK